MIDIRFSPQPIEHIYEAFGAKLARGVFEFDGAVMFDLIATHVARSWPRQLSETEDSIRFTLRESATLVRCHRRDKRAAARRVSDAFYSVACLLIRDDRFSSVYCPLCDAAFTPEKVTRDSMEKKDASGMPHCGLSRILCPAGHTVFATTDWIS